jgi:hypothetical protein
VELHDFLLARIAEDEAFGREHEQYHLGYMGIYERWMAECDAKRRIVEAHRWEEFDDGDGSVPYYTDCDDCRQGPPCRTLRLLALPYADHTDYREEWRP